jgi:hypothetical protein
MATCDLDRPLMLGATPFPLPLQLGHECVAARRFHAAAQIAHCERS